MKQSRWLLILFCIQGLLAVVWVFNTPSESGNAIVWTFSRERLLLLVVTLALWAGILGAAIWLWSSSINLEFVHEKLDQWCLEQKRLGPSMLFLFIIPLLIAAAALKVSLTPLEYAAYQSWAPDTFPLLHALVKAVLPLLFFLLLMAIELGAYLAIRYGKVVAQSESWAWERMGPSLILMLITIMTVFHWIVLVFQLRVFANNPAWYWKFEPIPFSWHDLWFTLAVLILLVLSYWLLILRGRAFIGLLAVFLLGWFLQIGVGIMSGGGFASVGDRYFSTYHKAYVSRASQNHLTILDNLRQYENLYGSHAFTSTKPPGLMAFYVGLEQLINGYPSDSPDDLRFERFSGFITYAFPLIAMSMVFLIYAFARRFLQNTTASVPSLASFLYVLCPNVVLFSLFADQAIYPPIFLLGVWFILLAIRRQSIAWGFLVGILLYGAVFLAFTMLPLYVFAGIFLIMDYWLNREQRQWKQPVLIAMGIGLGTLLLYVLFLYFLNYNFFPRFEKTMAINHNFDFYLRVGRQPPAGPESLSTRLLQIAGAAWLNNLDFAAGIGFPIYILFAVQSLRLLVRLFKGRMVSGDIVPMSLLSSFVVLNLAGTAQGEVPRLWLFWLPMVVIFASHEIGEFVQTNRFIPLGLALMQFMTIFLTYHFQDLRM